MKKTILLISAIIGAGLIKTNIEEFYFPSYQDIIIKKLNSIYSEITNDDIKISNVLEKMLIEDKSIQKKKEAIECKINRISRQHKKNKQIKIEIEIEKLKYFSFIKNEILTRIILLIDSSYNLEVKKVEEEKKKIAESLVEEFKIKLEAGTITPTDLAFAEYELENAKKNLEFVKLALSENKMNLDSKYDILNDNNIFKVEGLKELKEFSLSSNTELCIKNLEVKVEEKCNEKEKKYNLEKFKIEGLNKIENIKNKIKAYQSLEKSNQSKINALKLYVNGVSEEANFGVRSSIDVLNSKNSLQNVILESIKIKLETLKSYYQLLFLTI